MIFRILPSTYATWWRILQALSKVYIFSINSCAANNYSLKGNCHPIQQFAIAHWTHWAICWTLTVLFSSLQNIIICSAHDKRLFQILLWFFTKSHYFLSTSLIHHTGVNFCSDILPYSGLPILANVENTFLNWDKYALNIRQILFKI